MMNNKPKLLFAHDAKFYHCDGNYYTINLSEKVWSERYLTSFSQVTILARNSGDITAERSKNFTLASGKNIYFSLLPFENILLGSVLHREKYDQIITDAIKECDCVIVRLPSTVGLSVINKCEKLKKPYLVEVVGCPWDTMYNHSYKGAILAPFYYFLTRRALKNASHAIYITERFLQNRYPTSGKRGVCSNVNLPDLNSEGFAKKLSHINNHGPFVIGSCGSVSVKFKGQQFVIEAISILRKRGIDVTYEIVGGGSQSYLRSIANKFGVEQYVIFHGSKSGEDTKKWMSGLDVYVQPSLSEGQGRSLIEAMRMGCACMCSRVGGMVELLDDKYIFEKANPKAIAYCFEQVTCDLKSCMQSAYNGSLKFQPALIQEKRYSFFREFIKDKGLNK